MNLRHCVVGLVFVVHCSFAEKAIGYVDLGCFRENGSDMTDFVVNIVGMTYEKCLIVCRQKGFKFAGLHRVGETNAECRCGRTYGSKGHSKQDACLFPCPGNGRQMCGGAESSSIVFGYEGVDESYPGVNSASVVIIVVMTLWTVPLLPFFVGFIVSLVRAFCVSRRPEDDDDSQ